MRSFLSGRAALLIIVLVVIGVGLLVNFVFFKPESAPTPVVVVKPISIPMSTHLIIGKSIEGRNLEAYTYGTGTKELLFVGGIHGGYEWNSVLLAYQFMDYLEKNPEAIPKNLKITVIPSANPDGVYSVTGKEGRFTAADVSTDQQVLEAGRFNADKVDLNRNFDCKWQPKSTWQSKTVSAGSKAFSEPEAAALRDFILKDKPVGVIFWHSQANAVYASECKFGILPETLKMVDIYAEASGYQAIKTFDAYETTGDAEGWLASINIPAITVELKTHDVIEWEKNLTGSEALIKYFSQPVVD